MPHFMRQNCQLHPQINKTYVCVLLMIVFFVNSALAHHGGGVQSGNDTHIIINTKSFDTSEEARKECNLYRAEHTEPDEICDAGIGANGNSPNYSAGWDRLPGTEIPFYTGIFPIFNSDQGNQCQNEGGSVNLATGNEYHQESIHIGNGLDLAFSYNSNYRKFGTFEPDINKIAAGWTMSMSMYVSPVYTLNGQDYVIVHRGDGRYIPYDKVGSQWKSGVKDKHTLEKIASGWRFKDFSGSIELYNNNGQLISYEMDNQIRTVSYSGDFIYRITNQFGDYIEFEHSDVGSNYGSRYTSISDQTGRSWNLTYTGDNLTGISYPDQTSKLFKYEDSRHPYALTEIVDRNGNSFIFEYDNKGRVKHEEYVGGINALSINYGSNNQRRITNSRGKISTYQVGIHNGMWKVESIEGPGCSSCSNSDTTYSYDDQNNIILQNINGKVTQFGDYDHKGQYGFKVEAFGTENARRTEFTYHDLFYHKPTKIEEPSVSNKSHHIKTTTYTYDDHGNVLSMETAGYTPQGTLVSAKTTYQYNGPFNQISLIDGPRTDVADLTIYEYYADSSGEGHNRGRLERVTNPSGVVIQNNIQYTATGKIRSEEKPNGLITSFTYYPGNDRLETITQSDDSKNQVTYMTYMPSGEIASITRNFRTSIASTMTLEYDNARRLTKVTDGQGNYVEYILDTEGNQVAENTYDPNSILKKTISQMFDDFSNLKSTTQSGVTEKFNYGSNGLLYENTNGKQITTSYNYDALNRMIETTQNTSPMKSSPTSEIKTLFEYDVHNNLKAVVDANGNKTSYSYDDLGRMVEQNSPDTGSDHLTYDQAGNPVSKSDANNNTSLFTYDANNRLTNVNYPGEASDMVLSYDDQSVNGANLLTAFMNNKSSTTLGYDAFGNLTSKSQVVTDLEPGYDVSMNLGYQYDQFNRLTRITYPSGQVVSYHHNNVGQVIRVSTVINGQTINLVDQIEYMPMGPLKSMGLGNGLHYEANYDSGYRIENFSYGTTMQRGYSYDNNHNITTIVDGNGGKESYSYDFLDRLTKESANTRNISFNDKSYTYDNLGNRMSSVSGRQPPVTYSYQQGTNRLTDVGTSQRGYDKNGNTIGISDEQKVFTYNQANRLSQVEIAGELKAQYHYNAMGERVFKQYHSNASSEVNYLFIYNEQGQMVHEVSFVGDGFATQRWEDDFIWLEDRPIALVRTVYQSGVQHSQELFYIHSDHLNTPRQLSNANQTVVWRWDSDAFGTTQANQDPDNDGNKVWFRLRFPGQYHDFETNQHYNYFRDYEPATGRYKQSDPIGLEGGINTYAYVSVNPLNRFDSNGLQDIPMCALEGNCQIERLFPPQTQLTNCATNCRKKASSSWLCDGLGTATAKTCSALAVPPWRIGCKPSGAIVKIGCQEILYNQCLKKECDNCEYEIKPTPISEYYRNKYS